MTTQSSLPPSVPPGFTPDDSNVTDISLQGLDRAEVLAALYNASKPQGLGFLQARMVDMPKAEAAEYIKTHTREGPAGRAQCYFDYLLGRVMKVDIGGDVLRTFLYDRDNGPGAAFRALGPLLKARSVTAARGAQEGG